MIGLVVIVLLGIFSQLVAWFTRVPSILLLITAGFIAGPVLGILNPDALLGELFEPLVALSVAIILFEGGLNLKMSEVKATAPVVLRLISLGVLVTWVLATVSAYFLLDMELPIAILLGAILVVSGPTVIMPLLRYLRPGANVSTVLKWEGILIDPIGAILAIIVLEVILAGGGTNAAVMQVVTILLKSVAAGIILGGTGALIIAQVLRRHLLPDYLHIPATLGLLGGLFLTSEIIQPQAGLLTAIVMGVVLTNQRQCNISNILEFKENLRVLLISFIFIILSSRLELSLFAPLSLGLVLFILVLILLARPLGVFLSTIKSRIKGKEKWLLASIAPRGIVSAAIASVFAFRMASEGYPGAELLLPVTFAVIFGTILSSSLAAPLLIKGLKISRINPQGVVFIGGQIWLREIAGLLHKEKIDCLMITNNKANVAYARRKGLKAIYADVLDGSFIDDTDFSGYGYAVVATSDDNYNMLVALRLSKEFGSSNVFLLPVEEAKCTDRHFSEHLPGRTLFTSDANYDRITQLYETGKIKLETLKEDIDRDKLAEAYGKESLPMFALSPSGNLVIIAAGTNPEFKQDARILALIPAR